METLTEPITTERLLIYSNDQEINRVTSEIQTRGNLLNKILSYGIIANEEIPKVASSVAAIDDFIFQQQLKVNKELKKQFDAGKKNLKDEYKLPENLEGLKYSLLAWCNYPMQNRGASKFQFLSFENSRYVVDENKLEQYFEMKQNKVYVESEELEKYRKAEQLITLLKFFKADWNHIRAAPSLSKFIDANGQRIIPRWQYFKQP